VVLANDALAGKVAVVTGGGTGIGAGICEALARAGAHVVVSPHKNVDGAERTAAGIRQATGASAFVQACDVRDVNQVEALFDSTLREFGGVDILVNNAGITEPRPLLEMTVDEWDKTLNINLRGMFLCTQRAAREMLKRGGGRIVNLSSVHGFAAVPHHAHYEASKGGINMFTKASAIELAPHNIQVNAIAPGAIEVERYAAIPGYDRDEWGQGIPAGRVGWPDDIGPLAAFLCSDGASYITGQIIWVDGGMTSRLGGGRAQRRADQ
jgi:glucose 1-dehydrogenase